MAMPPFKFPQGKQKPGGLMNLLAMLGGGGEGIPNLGTVGPEKAAPTTSPVLPNSTKPPVNFGGLTDPSPQPPMDLRAILGAPMPTTKMVGPKPLGMADTRPDADSFASQALRWTDPAFTDAIGLGRPPSGTPAVKMPTVSAGPAAPTEPSLFDRLDAERGFSIQKDASGFGAPPQENASLVPSGLYGAIEEVMQRGADSPNKADNVLRMEFQDDPMIEDAIQQARQRYEDAKARSSQNPGVMEYVGYVLATLAGANPMQAAEAVSRRGEKRQDEQIALDQLLGAQGMKIQDRQQQRRQSNDMMMQIQDLLGRQQADQAQFAQRQQERAQDQQYKSLSGARADARQRLNMLLQQYPAPMKPPPEAQAEINAIKERLKYFSRQLGEPEQNEKGEPIGMDPDVSRSAMRMLGLG